MAGFSHMGKMTASSKAVTNRNYFGSQNLIDMYQLNHKKKLKMFRAEKLEKVGVF